MNRQYKYMVCTRCFTFNQAPYIEDAMRGFAVQETSFPVATIIVDDASTDGEPEVIRRFLSKNFEKPFREEETEYASIICARHKINPNCEFDVLLLKYNHHNIKKPKIPYLVEWINNAKYQAICEGDDYWIDDYKLQKQVDYLENNPDVSLCHTAFSFYDQEEHRLYENKVITNRNIEIEKITNNLVPFILMYNDYRIQTCSVLFNSLSYEKIENQELEMVGKFLMGDTQKWCLLNSVGHIRYMNDNTCVYRVIRGSASHQQTPLASSRFYLSSCEMRVYISRLFNLDKSYQTYFRKELLKALISHKMLDANYRPSIDPGFTFFERLKYGLYTSLLGRMMITTKKRLLN